MDNRPVKVKQSPERAMCALLDTLVELYPERAEMMLNKVKKQVKRQGKDGPDGEPRDLGLGPDVVD